MVFFPMSVYGLLKCLLNINSGYTLIVSNVMIFFLNQREQCHLIIPNRKTGAVR